MSEGGIKHPALAVHLRPGHRKIAIRAMDLWIREVQFGSVQARQYPHFTARKVLVLVDLVADREPYGKPFITGIPALPRSLARENAHGWSSKYPRHLAEFGPIKERIVTRMRTHKPLALFLDDSIRSFFCCSFRLSPVPIKKMASKSFRLW